MNREILAIAELYQQVISECDRAGVEYIKQVFNEYVDSIDAYAESKEKEYKETIDILECDLCECREHIEALESEIQNQ